MKQHESGGLIATSKRDKTTVQRYLAGRVKKIKTLLAPGYDKDDDRSTIVDALTDLRHYADKADMDFFELLDSSYFHYLAERRGGEFG